MKELRLNFIKVVSVWVRWVITWEMSDTHSESKPINEWSQWVILELEKKTILKSKNDPLLSLGRSAVKLIFSFNQSVQKEQWSLRENKIEWITRNDKILYSKRPLIKTKIPTTISVSSSTIFNILDKIHPNIIQSFFTFHEFDETVDNGCSH